MTGWTRALFAVALAGATLPAHAAISTIGGGFGRACYEAAELRRDPRASLEVCDRALSEEMLSRRDRAATLVNRGIIRMRARDLKAALADYEEALRNDPGVAEAHINRGIALLHIGNRDREAVEALTQGLAMNPARPEVALYSRAVAYEMLGDVRQAFNDYSAAAAANPNWDEPAEQLRRFSVEKVKTGRG